MQKVYQPEDSILRQRAEFSRAFSPLRRIRPRVPFWCLPAHRIPTLWSLYRGLIRLAPGNNVKWRIRMFFENNRHLTSAKATREKLLWAHKLLDSFQRASGGDERLQRVVSRYDSMIRAKRDKEDMKSMILEQLAWQDRLRNRPIMTGALLRPTILNGPLPRLKPQPQHISMMIKTRLRAYERIGPKYAWLKEMMRDIETEINFEKALRREIKGQEDFEPVFYPDAGWGEHVEAQMKGIRGSLERGAHRARTPYSPELLAAMKEARRERIRNKTRERERERRGEVLRCTVERNRKGPPAHILVKMPEWRRRADKVIRQVGEVGYVGMMKSRLGVRMKNPNLWRELEEGTGGEPKDQECVAVLDNTDEDGGKFAEKDEEDVRIPH